MKTAPPPWLDPLTLAAIQRAASDILPERLASWLREQHLFALAVLLHQSPREDSALPWSLSDSDFAEINRHYLSTQAVNIELTSDTLKLFDQLREASIPHAALKGLANLALLYEDAGLRPLSDVDILIPSEHGKTAIEMASGLGYDISEVPNDPEILLTRATTGKYLHIEIHFTICQTRRYPIDHNRLWERRQNVKWGELELPCLHPVDHFLHMVLNLVHDRFDAPLLKFLELYWLYSGLSAEMKTQLQEEAGQAECAIAVNTTLQLLQEWIDPAIDVEPSGASHFLNSNSQPPYRRNSRLRDLAFGLALMDRPGRKFTFAWDYLLRRAGLR